MTMKIPIASADDVSRQATRLKESWGKRNDQILRDRDLLNLRKPKAVKGRSNMVSNEPKVFFDTATALISSYPPRYRLPIPMAHDEAEQTKMNKAERLIVAIFRCLNENMLDTGDPNAYWLRAIARQMLSGWYSFMWRWEMIDGVPTPRTHFYDPINIYPKWDNYGLSECVRWFTLSGDQANFAQAEYQAAGLNFGENKYDVSGQVDVMNYWLRERQVDKKTGKVTIKVWNSIRMGDDATDKLVQPKPMTEHPKLKQIPIMCGAIGMPEKTSGDWPIRYGESIIAANRDMYKYENQMINLMMTIVAATAFPNIISWSATGRPIIKEDQKGYGQEIALKHNQKVDLLKHASTPEEVNVILTWLSSRKQKGSVPDIVYGGVPFELSGFAISQLLAAIRYKLAPYLNMMQLVMGRLSRNFLEQYREEDLPKITLTTVDKHAKKKGLLYYEDFSKDDIPARTYVDVTIPVTSAVDKTQQILFARKAMEDPRLFSRETLWESYLDVEDPDQEYTRILEDEMLDSEIMKKIGILERLKERELKMRQEGRHDLADALRRYIMMAEMELGIGQGQAKKPGGFSPEQLPPEMVDNPDQQRAAQDVPPPGLRRRPQTNDERQESKSRIVSPGGKTLIE